MKEKRTLTYMRERLREEYLLAVKDMRAFHHQKLQAQRNNDKFNTYYYANSVTITLRHAEMFYDMYRESIGYGRYDHTMRRVFRDRRKYKRAKEGL